MLTLWQVSGTSFTVVMARTAAAGGLMRYQPDVGPERCSPEGASPPAPESPSPHPGLMQQPAVAVMLSRKQICSTASVEVPCVRPVSCGHHRAIACGIRRHRLLLGWPCRALLYRRSSGPVARTLRPRNSLPPTRHRLELGTEVPAEAKAAVVVGSPALSVVGSPAQSHRIAAPTLKMRMVSQATPVTQ